MKIMSVAIQVKLNIIKYRQLGKAQFIIVWETFLFVEYWFLIQGQISRYIVSVKVGLLFSDTTIGDKKNNYNETSDNRPDRKNEKKNIDLVPLQIVISRNGKNEIRFL